MWSIEAWEKLMLFFPDNNNESRIMITTRLSNVAKYFGSSGFKMNFLDEDKSWKLFCKIVFPQDQCCPLELEETGKKIARNCKGLPLSIVVIGGLLANSGQTQQHWKYVEKNLNSMVNLEDDQYCLNILYLSYNHLPIHLKPCFLHMGVYPEDSIIRVSQLLQLWVAEGFLRPIKDRRLEVLAEDYLNELIDRNLILIEELGSNGEVIKYCKIHDLLRDLCVREAEKDKFVWVRTVHLENLEGMQSQRRIRIHEGTSKEYHIDAVQSDLVALPSASLARSLTCQFKDANLSSHSFRLVRVFNMESKRPYEFGKNKRYGYSLKDIFELVNSRYLYIVTHSKSILPSSMHLLWNLQTLIIKKGGIYYSIHVPPEIWEMSELRHLEIHKWFSMPDPPNVPLIHDRADDYFILRNLRTIKRVRNFKLREEVIKRIPNIKKLRVWYDDFGGCRNCCLNNLGLLNELESLYINGSFGSERSWQIEYLQNFAFPHSLKKLTLCGTNIFWEDITKIGSLPYLQVLKLKFNAFLGPEWNPVEGEFLYLKFLLIESCYDLVYWNAKNTHFPCLEQLVLIDFHNLEEIPLDIGYISTLRTIELRYCSYSVIMSAKDLLDEQVEFGNDDLQVRVFCQENVDELKSLAANNFQVKS